MNGDGGWNVLDIVNLANCVLANNCSDLGRANDATEASLLMENNEMYIKADGFIGGVQMTLSHGDDFSIEMTDKAMVADYRTEGNSTTLMVVNPESDELYIWVIIEQVDLDRMAEDVHGKVIRKQLKDAGEEHRDTIKNTFDEEFEKQFSQ